MHIPAKGKTKRGDTYDIQRYIKFYNKSILLVQYSKSQEQGSIKLYMSTTKVLKEFNNADFL